MRPAVGILLLVALVNANGGAVSQKLPSECNSVVYEYFMWIASIGCNPNGLKRSCCGATPLDRNFERCIDKYYKDDNFCRFRVSMNNNIYKRVSNIAEATISQKVATMIIGAVVGLF